MLQLAFSFFLDILDVTNTKIHRLDYIKMVQKLHNTHFPPNVSQSLSCFLCRARLYHLPQVLPPPLHLREAGPQGQEPLLPAQRPVEELEGVASISCSSSLRVPAREKACRTRGGQGCRQTVLQRSRDSSQCRVGCAAGSA